MANTFHDDDIDWPHYMRDTDAEHRIRPASSWREQVRIRRRDGRVHRGAVTPWPKTNDQLRYRPGEVSLCAGDSGAGKTTYIRNLFLGFMAQGQRCAIASMEVKPVDTLAQMSRQASMGPYPTDAFDDRFFDWTDDKLWLYDQQGVVPPQRMLAVARYCAEHLKIDHLCVDSLMKVVRDEDDYNGQKNFVDTVGAVARDSVSVERNVERGMHVHLVHHMRKRENTDRPGGKHDLKGSGAITDQIDLLTILFRNKKKLEAMKLGKEFDPAEPDAVINVDKQRNDEFEGRIALWIHQPSLQFVQSVDGKPVQFLPDDYGTATREVATR